MRFWVIVKGGVEAAVSAARKRGLVLDVVRQIDNDRAVGGHVVAVNAMPLVRWLHDGLTPPFPVGSLLWWRPI